MRPSCRQNIRRAERQGVTIEPASDAAFADDYYAQLREVFGRQGLVPTYGVEHVRALLRHLLPTGRILLLRARDAQGRCIATGLYPAWNKIAQFWGNASRQDCRQVRPNEALNWYALRALKARGIEQFDWGGRGVYKEKYGPYPLAVVRLSKSRYRWLPMLREQARRLVGARQRLLGSVQGLRRALLSYPPGPADGP